MTDQEKKRRSTDGPWHYVPWHITEGPSEVRHADGWLICTTPSDDSARLIAASPDMLAALKRAKQFIINGIELGFIRMPSTSDPAHETLPAIESAISKATQS